MKSIFFITLILSSVSALSFTSAEAVKRMNTFSEKESMTRKYESELAYKKHQVEKSNHKITLLTNEANEAQSNYRLAITENQFLKKQNDELINSIKNNGNFTPELANKVKIQNGRLPASVQDKSTK